MKTVLRLNGKFIDVKNPNNMIPRKDDNFVFKGQSYIVSYVEFDFDDNTVYIVSIF
jgi:hypothetical protein